MNTFLWKFLIHLYLYLYISKNRRAKFIIVMLLLRHLIRYVIGHIIILLGKVFLHSCIKQLLHIGLCGGKKKLSNVCLRIAHDPWTLVPFFLLPHNLVFGNCFIPVCNKKFPYSFSYLFFYL